MDYWKHLDLEVVDDWLALRSRLNEANMWFFSKTATHPYTEVQFESDPILVFGAESEGLPRSLLAAHPERCLRIPVHANARSLNLSVSVAVAAFEAQRQLRHGSASEGQFGRAM